MVAQVTTLYLGGPVITTLVVEVEEDGASVAGWGKGPGEYFGFGLTDTERLLFAASLLREGESVRGESETTATMKQGGRDE
jgi:hypothetical protein